jgi:hypothetical protein
MTIRQSGAWDKLEFTSVAGLAGCPQYRLMIQQKPCIETFLCREISDVTWEFHTALFIIRYYLVQRRTRVAVSSATARTVTWWSVQPIRDCRLPYVAATPLWISLTFSFVKCFLYKCFVLMYFRVFMPVQHKTINITDKRRKINDSSWHQLSPDINTKACVFPPTSWTWFVSHDVRGAGTTAHRCRPHSSRH